MRSGSSESLNQPLRRREADLSPMFWPDRRSLAGASRLLSSPFEHTYLTSQSNDERPLWRAGGQKRSTRPQNGHRQCGLEGDPSTIIGTRHRSQFGGALIGSDFIREPYPTRLPLS
jgi:hypothetical protein